MMPDIKICTTILSKYLSRFLIMNSQGVKITCDKKSDVSIRADVKRTGTVRKHDVISAKIHL
jgi:hypothetical protein